MEIKPIEYPRLIKHDITITEKIILESGGRLYFDTTLLFRHYPNKPLQFVFNDEIFDGIFRTENNRNFIENNQPNSIQSGSIISIYETFSVNSDHEALTYQDTIDRLRNVEIGKYFGIESQINIDKVGSFGLLDSFEKSKLLGVELFVMQSLQQQIDITFSEILSISQEIGNVKSTIILSNIDGFIKLEINYSSVLGVHCSVIESSFATNKSLTFQFVECVYSDGTKYLSVRCKSISGLANFIYMFSVVNIDQLIKPTLTINEENIIQIAGVDEIFILSTIISFTQTKIRLIEGGGSTGGDSALTEDIIASGVNSYLGIPDGTIVPTGTTFQEWLTGFYRRVIHPTYIQPIFALTPANTSIEAGSNVAPTIVPTFTQNDAGPVNNYILNRLISGQTIQEIINSISLTTYIQDPEIQIGDGIWLTYSSICSYNEGLTKNNNLNEPDPYGKILAGSLSRNIIFTGIRRGFYGADTLIVPCASSNDVRDLSTAINSPANNTSFNIQIPAGATRVTFAYLNTLRNVSSVKFVQGMNAEIKDVFNLSLIDVAGNNNYLPLQYKIYTYIPLAPFSQAATYNVTI